MAKKVKAVIKLQLPGGKATPGQSVGSALGPHGIPTMDFLKQFFVRRWFNVLCHHDPHCRFDRHRPDGICQCLRIGGYLPAVIDCDPIDPGLGKDRLLRSTSDKQRYDAKYYKKESVYFFHGDLHFCFLVDQKLYDLHYIRKTIVSDSEFTDLILAFFC